MSSLRILDLRCEYLVAPLGIDERAPRLSWRLDCGHRRGAHQRAFRIRVASTADRLARDPCDLWDSGRIETTQTAHVAYAGAPLLSRAVCHWDVEVWDETGGSARSTPSLWSMGLLGACDWEAQWIAANPAILARDPDAVVPTLTEPGTPALFRREFELPAVPARATLYASARGILELRANGRAVSPDRFAPEWTDYDTRIHFRTYDIATLLQPGRNCLAATLGDGWWSGYVGWQETRARYGSLENSLMLQLEVELDDGRRVTLCTDDRWTCHTGPILQSDFQMGETYDARREHDGWDRPFFAVAESSGPGSAGCLPAVASGEGRVPPAESGVSPDTSSTAAPRTTAPSPSHSELRSAISDLRAPNSELRAPISGPLPWLPAREVAAPRAALVAQRSEPVRLMEEFAPLSLTQHRPGVLIADFGQNIAGVVRLELSDLPAGTRLVVRHGERLAPDGSLYTENLRRARSIDTYIARGATTEIYEPRFTFHGFQYAEITAHAPDAAEACPRDDLLPRALVRATACVIRSATPPAGHFECSHPGVNRLWLNGLWSQRDNFLSVPTDCPQRDERLGWMGDAQVFLRTATCNMDVAAFFTKWMIDVEDAQTADGIFPDVAPRIREDLRFVGLDDLCGGAGWADAGILVPWTIWRVYGDTRIIERHWSAMVAWLDQLERTNPDGLRTRELHNNYGDWLCIPTDTSFRTQSPMKDLLATAYWATDAARMAQMARALGRESEAARFQAMFEKVRTAFQRMWVREDGRLAVETQTAYLLALAFDLLPSVLRERATAHLVENIRALDWHLSTGFIGISHLNPVLTLEGRADVAYRLLLQETYPSWLYPVRHGATTIWERWNGWTEADGFFVPHMNSFNHYSLGSVGEWLFRHVAGIELDPDVPGYQRFVLRPYIGHGLDHARATLRTMHGEIESAWRREGDTLTWSITVPANTTALVHLPCTAQATIETDGLAILHRAADHALCEAPAGRYTLRARGLTAPEPPC